jgi:hypothetical protein
MTTQAGKSRRKMRMHPDNRDGTIGSTSVTQ